VTPDPGRPPAPFGVLLLSTADWDAVLWTNKQHTARSLRDHGATVLYVESLGLRAPTLSAADRRRVLRRVARALRPPREVEPGILVWSPLALPWHGSRLVRRVNRLVLSGLLRFWAGRVLGPAPVVWTYNPLTLALLALPPGGPLVYHCVDDLAAQPGIPAAAVTAHEPALVAAADHVFVTSRELESRWSRVRPVHYEPNCVDAARFAPAGGPSTGSPEPPALARVPRPRIGFVGAVAAYKIDVELLAGLADRNPDWSLVLVGPREDDDPAVTALLARANVHHLGPVPHDAVPAHVRALDVGLVPARPSDYATAMFPMKFFEYLAAGVPVVATPLPALREFGAAAAMVPPSGFEEAVRAELRGPTRSARARRAAWAGHTYTARTARMLARVLPAGPAREGP
jgi:glycosyltransferase involved in cell wall biosynthesis